MLITIHIDDAMQLSRVAPWFFQEHVIAWRKWKKDQLWAANRAKLRRTY